MSDAILIPENIVFNCYKNDIVVGHSSFDVNLLRLLLSDNYYYQLKKLIKSGSSIVEIDAVHEDELLPYTKFSIRDFSRALEELLFSDISDKEFDRILYIREKTSMDSFIDKYKNKSSILLIDNYKYKIRFKDIIDFLTLNEPFYENIFKTFTKELYGIRKDHFLYAVNYLLDSYDITSLYDFPDYIKQRLLKLRSFRAADFEAINKFVETNDHFVNGIIIDNSLYNEVMGSIPSNYDQTDSSIYVYIKLCQLLKYDPVFYMSNQKGDIAKVHEDIKRISRIKPGSNVVCYEFNLLYGFFLKELGINFESSNIDKTKYGGSHTSLRYRVGKYLVSADAVTSILYGDLTGCKSKADINGLTCYNMNSKTRDEFQDRINRICNDMYDKKTTTYTRLKNDTYRKIYRLYPLNLRFNNYIDDLNNCSLDGLDAMGYALRLRRLLFSEIEREDYVHFNILCDNRCTSPELTSIITVGNEEFDYYEYKPNEGVRKVSKEYVEGNMNKGNITYIKNSIEEIPGIRTTYESFGIRKSLHLKK